MLSHRDRLYTAALVTTCLGASNRRAQQIGDGGADECPAQVRRRGEDGSREPRNEAAVCVCNVACGVVVGGCVDNGRLGSMLDSRDLFSGMRQA